MNKLIIIVMFLLTTAITTGQLVETPGLTRDQAKSFLQSLHTPMADTTRIDMLLQLADYYIREERLYKAGLDSAIAFMQHATILNDKIRSRKFEGYIGLIQAKMAHDRNDTATANEFLNESIRLLESTNDAFKLVLAYTERLSWFDVRKAHELAEINSSIPRIFLQLKKIKDPAQKPEGIHAIAWFYQNTLNHLEPENKLNFLTNFLSGCRTINDGPGEVWIRKEIADIHYQQGKIKEAKGELLELLAFQKAGGYPSICFTYDLLAGVYYSTFDFTNALYYALETIKSVSSKFDSTYLPEFYSRISGIHNYQSNEEQAHYWNMKAVEYQLLTGEKYTLYSVSKSAVKYFVRFNKAKEALKLVSDVQKKVPPKYIDEKQNLVLMLGLCYQALRNNVLAEKYFEEAVRLYEISNDSIGSSTLEEVVSFYLATGQYAKTLLHLKTMLKTPPTSGRRPAWELYRTGIMYQVEQGRGNYESAFKYLLENRKLSDSIFTVTKNKQVSELRIAYETDQKDDSIKLKDKDIALLRQQNELQQANLRQASLIKDVTIAGIILAIIIIGLIYRQYKLKQKSNVIISDKNKMLEHLVTEKDWLVKEIHHRVKNNLHTVMGLLGTQAGYLEHEEAINAISNSQHRIQAMSLIHQRLYQSNNLSAINMKEYIHELVDSLNDSFNNNNHVWFNLEIDPIQLNLAHCIPLGLILN